MNIAPLRTDKGAERAPFIAPATIEIRHLVFDMCASHDLKANGVYNVARQIASEQRAAGHSVSIVFLRNEDRVVPEEGSEVPIAFLTLEGAKLLGRRISMSSDLLDAISAPGEKPLFFHIHTARQPMLVPVVMRLRKLNIPYAITVHGRYSHLDEGGGGAKRRLSNLYLHHVERRLLEGARFVQGVSREECDLIRRVAPRARVKFVQNAAYSSHFEGTPPAERIAPSERFPLFGFLGRYEIEHKGLDLLVGGFAAYRHTGGKGRLVMVGTGPAREDVIARAGELGVADHVEAGGPRFGAEKKQALASWDYFVMPSRFEGMPVGALEAALAGLPLIVTAETGLRDEVTQFGAGIGIDGLTTGAVAAALAAAEARGAEEWRHMSASARRLALSHGDWTEIAANLVSLYQGA